MQVRRATQRDLPAITRIVTDAFSVHPLREALLPGKRRRRLAIRIGDTALVLEAMAYGTAFVAELDGQVAGVLGWLAPEHHPRPRARGLLLTGLRIPFLFCPPHGFAGFAVDACLKRFHRNEPSLYFTIAATDPRLSRRGVASALLRHMTEEADRLGVSVFLETSNGRNLALYGRHGFQVVDRAMPVPNGPEMFAMLRPSPHVSS